MQTALDRQRARRAQERLTAGSALRKHQRLAGPLLPAGIPPGGMIPYAGDPNSVPQGWLLAAGQAVSRTEYAALFAAIGTTFGNGDGSTTFNLPDTKNRFVVGSGDTYARAEIGGATTHRHTESGHTHDLHLQGDTEDATPFGGLNVDDNDDGARAKTVDNTADTGGVHHHAIDIQTATAEGSIETDTAEHIPPYLGLPHIIKT